MLRRLALRTVVGATVAGATVASVLLVPAARLAAQPPTPAIAAGDSATPATIDRLLQVSDAERGYQRGVDASIDAQLKANPALRPYADVMRSFAAKYSSYAQLKPDLVQIYRETFSEREVRELITFYQSDFGRRMMAKLPALTARSSELAARRMQAHLPELMRTLQQRMGQSPP